MSFKQKISSRKLWAAIAGVVAGLAMAFGLDDAVVNTASGAVVMIASIVAYIITEGRVDAAAVSDAAKKVSDVISEITSDDEN
jgi:phage shock protein PspC (stress-responsive transcriptional regulator)